MNTLDFSNRIRAFLPELCKRHNITQTAGPIADCNDILSKKLHETLTNWAEYYKKLYFCADPVVSFLIPDDMSSLIKFWNSQNS